MGEKNFHWINNPEYGWFWKIVSFVIRLNHDLRRKRFKSILVDIIIFMHGLCAIQWVDSFKANKNISKEWCIEYEQVYETSRRTHIFRYPTDKRRQREREKRSGFEKNELILFDHLNNKLRRKCKSVLNKSPGFRFHNQSSYCCANWRKSYMQCTYLKWSCRFMHIQIMPYI